MHTAHPSAVQAAFNGHIARLAWLRSQLEAYQIHQLRALLTYTWKRSPFNTRQVKALDLSCASVDDLASLSIMTKRDTQEQWDTSVTAPHIDRDRAEHVPIQQQWFS